MRITIPDFCLAVLITAPGSIGPVFASRHFRPAEVVSRSRFSSLLEDDLCEPAPPEDVARLVHAIAESRLRRRGLTVIDAPGPRREERAALVALARRHHAQPVAIIIGSRRASNLPGSLDREGFRSVHTIALEDGLDQVGIERAGLAADARHIAAPFDFIGDVHGCADELEALLGRLGYQLAWQRGDAARPVRVVPPAGRRAIFLGDLVDRGPRSPDVLRIAMAMVEAGSGLAVLGNHDAKLLRWLDGRNVVPAHGLARTIEQLGRESGTFRSRVREFIASLEPHLWLDGGRLAATHAGLKEEMVGRVSGAVREMCLYGETTGETDANGLPVRLDWARRYRGETTIVYGHTPVLEPCWVANTICVDTGCVFGGRLTALRWPEREIVSVPAMRNHAASDGR